MEGKLWLLERSIWIIWHSIYLQARLEKKWERKLKRDVEKRSSCQEWLVKEKMYWQTDRGVKGWDRDRERQRHQETDRDREVQTVTDRVKEWDEERERDVKTVWHLLSWHRRHHTVSQAAVICTWLKVLNMSIHKGPISRSLDDNNSLNLPDLIYNKLNSLRKT